MIGVKLLFLWLWFYPFMQNLSLMKAQGSVPLHFQILCSLIAIMQRWLIQSTHGIICCSCLIRRRQWHPTPVLLPGKTHGQRTLVGCSPGGREESDTTEQLHFHFSLSRTGEGNGNPLQCSCLENPRDGGACWAAVYGVAQSQTRLKQLSSSSSSSSSHLIMFLFPYSVRGKFLKLISNL